MRLTNFARLIAPLLIVGTTVGCDTDLYSDTSACRDGDANTVCPIDGSRDGPEPSDAIGPVNAAEKREVS